MSPTPHQFSHPAGAPRPPLTGLPGLPAAPAPPPAPSPTLSPPPPPAPATGTARPAHRGGARVRLRPFDADLGAAGRVLLREVTPADRALLQAGFDRLSDRSRYLRFLGAHPRLTPAELDRFVAPGDGNRAAIGAVGQAGPTPVPMGIARYVRLPDTPEAAEFALTVVDDVQGTGLGSFLLGALARHATASGIDSFVGYLRGDNTGMLRIARQLGASCSRLGGDLEVRIPLFACAAAYPESRAGAAFRRAYAGAALA